MSKIFLEETHEPIEIELKDLDKNSYLIKSNKITLGDIEFIEDLNSNKELKESEKITSILIRVFGKEPDFWKKFSLELLLNLTNIVTGEIKKKQNQEDK